MTNVELYNKVYNKIHDIIEDIDIYFNEELHRYTDNFNNTYTSVTTVIGKYEYKFEDKAIEIARACERIGRNKNHPKYILYKDKSWRTILNNWDRTKNEACQKGNKKHNYLETSINAANGYTLNKDGYINGKIYTISSILDNHNFGILNLEFFIKTGIKDKYPIIYNIIEKHVNMGYSIYAEIGTYNKKLLVSGLIDVCMIHWNNNTFKILDWKTNVDKIKDKAGYFTKNEKGGRTNTFIATDEVMKYPLNHLAQCSRNIYGLQLSIYAYLIELFGLVHEENILAHIRNVLDKDGLQTTKEEIDIIYMPYLKQDVIKLLEHHYNSLININTQTNLFM